MKNKKIYLYITCITLISALISVLGCIEEEVEGTPTSVTISGRQLLVNEEPFMIKGVGYSPVPIGDDPVYKRKDYFTSEYSGIYDRDLTLLKEMGANTVRITWKNPEDHRDFLDKAYANGIYVILNFYVSPNADISSKEVRDKLKSEFRKTVKKYKNHPAILMWAVGNELNAKWRYSKEKMDDLFSLLDEMVLEAHQEEGDKYHPVTSSLVDAELINTIKDYDGKKNLDVWSIQIFRGRSFGKLFKDYANVSSRPLIVLEFGIDSFDDRNQKINESIQAEYISSLWKEIENSGIVTGGAVTSYSDQWWKGKYANRAGKFNCPDDDNWKQSDCGYPIGSFSDGYSNEEYMGIMKIKDNGNKPDIVEPKEAYYELKKLWKSE